MDFKIRRAILSDVPAIQQLVNAYADQGKMLHRSLDELCSNIRDYTVADRDGTLLGCAATEIFGENLAEVKSIAVSPTAQRTGVGRALVEKCAEDARALGIGRLFCLTFQPEFFEAAGFKRVEREALPKRIWAECVCCPGYPDCGELAMVMELSE